MDDRAFNSHQTMESKTQFDLNLNLELWRQSLAQSPSFQPDNLDELEVHLRDSVSTLEGKGLSTEEAFHIATRRLGQPTALDKEFGKVNAETVWLSRWLWMAVGIFLFFCVQSLRGITEFALMSFGKHFAFSAHIVGFLTMAASVVLFAAPILFLRRLVAPHRKSRSQFVNRSILKRPGMSIAALIVLSVSLTVISIVGNNLAWRGATAEQVHLVQTVAFWRTWPVTLTELILLPIAIVYLYRRQLKACPTQA